MTAEKPKSPEDIRVEQFLICMERILLALQGCDLSLSRIAERHTKPVLPEGSTE
jgi:hypothetical protein